MILRPADLVNLAEQDTGRQHLSHSSIGTLLACQQKFAFHYEERLSPAVRPVALGMGDAFAQALEHADPDVAYTTVMDEQAREERANVGNPFVVVPDRQAAEITAVQAREAARCYLTHYGPSDGREHEMRVRLRNPATGHYSNTFDLLCRVDALQPDGTMIEDKFVSQVQAGDMDRRLRIDRQLTIETYCVWRTTGRLVEDISYRMTRKPTIRRKQNESHDDYLLRVAADYAERPDFYLHEFRPVRRLEDFLRLEAELWRWAEQVRDARRDGVWPRNTAECGAFTGCRYIAMCAGEPGAIHQFERRPERPLLVPQLVTSEERTAA